jgi:UDP-N-acetylmuramyl tripeptide synthase
MRIFLAVVVGRLIRQIAKLRGGGSAIPGKLALLVEPRLLEKTLGALRFGVVFVSGSNGKSTTTALVTGALRSQGLRVFTNPSGGNLPQGIASAVIGQSKIDGTVNADIAVLEVDEAYGPLIAKYLAPSWVVLTNLQIDQLNRFFEPERVLNMLVEASASATKGVLINGTDRNLLHLAEDLKGSQVFQVQVSQEALRKWPEGALAAPSFRKTPLQRAIPIAARVLDEVGGVSRIDIGDHVSSVKLPGIGLHFAIDTALALAVSRQILGQSFDLASAVEAISMQETVFGRGENVRYQGVELRILMMKNPSSMRANLMSMEQPETAIWIAMDEGTPDPSWIYDIDLAKIPAVKVVSGSRAWHWAVRLSYSEISVDEVVTDSKKALKIYVDHLRSVGKSGILLTNYEQMMIIRRHMGFLEMESGK